MEITNFRTSGAYVLYRDRFIFQVGPTKDGSRLGVVRLGGHREKNETALETAKREVYEEAAVHIKPLDTANTFQLREWNDEPFNIRINNPVRPILIKGSEKTSYTVMYFSYTDTAPKPTSETKGLLLLTHQDIHQICSGKITLNDYEQNGGLSLIKSDMNKDLILHPFPQLLFLSKLLKEEKGLLQCLTEF